MQIKPEWARTLVEAFASHTKSGTAIVPREDVAAHALRDVGPMIAADARREALEELEELVRGKENDLSLLPAEDDPGGEWVLDKLADEIRALIEKTDD